MHNIAAGYGFALLTAIAVIMGNYVIKIAADDALPFSSRQFLIGSALYLVSAVMWYGSMRYVSVVQAGVAYSMLTLLAVCAMGVVVFDDAIHGREILGIGLALLSMVLMARFV